jgi:hypothetical protein
VWTTPFGSPVVPDVNWTVAVLSGPGGAGGARRGGAGRGAGACSAGAEVLLEAARAGRGEAGAGREDVPQRGHLRLDVKQHARVVEAAEARRNDAEPGLGPFQDELDLTVPQDRQDGVGDRADAGAGQVHDGELPPVGQLVGDDLAGLDAEREQPGGRLVHEGRELAVGVPLRFPVGVVADDGDLARLALGLTEEVVEMGGVSPPAAAVISRGGAARGVVAGHAGCPFRWSGLDQVGWGTG